MSNNEVSLESLFDCEDARSLRFERLLAALPHRLDSIREGEIRRSVGTAHKIARNAAISIDREWGLLRCEQTRDRLLEAAYDEVGRFAWVFEKDTPPTLKKYRPRVERDEQTLARCELALAKGNRVRARRKEMKLALRSGELTLVEVFADPASETWQVGKIVVHAAKVNLVTGEVAEHRSPSQTHVVLRRLRISPTTPVAALGVRQKGILLAELDRVLTLKTTKAKVAA